MGLRKNAKVELIKRVPLFAHCSKAELSRVAMIADEIDFPAGKTLARQGDTGREFFVLVDGAADVTRGGRTINELRGGDFFGEISLVAKTPRTATVTTTAPSRLLVLTDRALLRLLRDSPRTQQKVLQAVAERLARAAG